MKTLAKAEIAKQLVNGSDNKSANQSEATRSSFIKVVQAGQILNYLGYSEDFEDTCQWLAAAELDDAGIETLFYKAEGLRLFNCAITHASFKNHVQVGIESVMKKPDAHITSINDLFSAFMLNKRASHYGVKNQGDTFNKYLVEELDKKLIDDFSPDTFGLQSAPGVSIDSIRLVELMSTLMKDSTVGEKISKRVMKGLQRLFDQASSTSVGDLEENQIFFVAPKGAYSPESMDLTQLNFHVLTILKQANLKLKTLGLRENTMSLYRNYFLAKAQSTNIQCLYYALRGLKSMHDQGHLEDINTTMILYDAQFT